MLMIGLIVLSCGIKKHPIPPVERSYYVKRVGEGVYVISREDIKVNGFVFHKGVWYRKERKGFCFEILRGKDKDRVCVGEALLLKPFVVVKEGSELVEVYPSGFSRYYIYPYRRKWIYVNLGKRVEGDKIIIKRYETRKCYAITGAVGDRESEPYVLCVDPYKP